MNRKQLTGPDGKTQKVTDTNPNAITDREIYEELNYAPIQVMHESPGSMSVLGELHMDNMIEGAEDDGEVFVATWLQEAKADDDFRATSPSEVDAFGRRPGETREQWEGRVNGVQSTVGQESELPEERERARDFEEQQGNRAEQNREAMSAYADAWQEDFEERAKAGGSFEYSGLHDRDGEEADSDPRRTLSQEELAQVNEAIEKACDDIGMAADKKTVGRAVARAFQRGHHITTAIEIVVGRYREGEYGIRPIDSIEPWMARYDTMAVTVQGEVVDAYEPFQNNQYQVLKIDDGTQTIKCTVWKQAVHGRNHRQDDPEYTPPRVGAEVIVEDARVNAFGGGKVALGFIKNQDLWTESRMHILEQGDGELVTNTPDIEASNGPANERAVTDEDALKAQVEKRERGYHNAPQEFIDIEADPDEIGDFSGGEHSGPETYRFDAASCPDWFLEQDEVEVRERDGDTDEAAAPKAESPSPEAAD